GRHLRLARDRPVEGGAADGGGPARRRVPGGAPDGEGRGEGGAVGGAAGGGGAGGEAVAGPVAVLGRVMMRLGPRCAAALVAPWLVACPGPPAPPDIPPCGPDTL